MQRPDEQRGRRRWSLLVLALASGCRQDLPVREFDCAAIAEAYATGCGGHLGISIDTTACEALRSGQNGALAWTIDRAAAVCEEVSLDLTTPDSCDALFVCLDDEHGLAALTRAVQVSGSATTSSGTVQFEGVTGWGWIGTTKKGSAGDFEVLFNAMGRPWYFRLDSFVERARTKPFDVDMLRPIKLESSVDNVELVAGEVVVTGFEIDGAFDVAAKGEDPLTGEALAVRFVGSFAE